jgi:hypothetical protein
LKIENQEFTRMMDLRTNRVITLNTMVGIAEIVSAICIVISVIYVSMQINQNTVAIKSASAQSVQENFASWYTSVQGDPKLLEISINGFIDYEALNTVEKAQFVAMFMSFSSYAQNAFYKWKEGSLSDELWRSWEYILVQFVLSPGGKDFWAERAYLFGETFRDYVEKDLMLREAHPDAKTWGTLPVDSLSVQDSSSITNDELRITN